MNSSSKPLRQPGLLVYFCGIATSVLALWGVDKMNESGENIMGWYANGIIPVGALIVGVVSGLGYALGSRFLNVKLSKTFVTGMIVTGLLDYVAAQYLTYTHILEKHHLLAGQFTFLDYIRDISENMAFKSSGSNSAGSALGAWGYLYKVLEMGGYALGCMVPSSTVFGMPYCRSCQSYLKAHKTGYMNSPEQWAEVKKLPKKERLAALQLTVQTLAQRVQEMVDKIIHSPFPETVAVVESLDAKFNKASAAYVSLVLKKYPQCDAHHIRLTLVNKTVDKKDAYAVLSSFEKGSGAV